MKRIKTRTTDFILVVAMYLLLASCQDRTSQQANSATEIIPNDTIYVACDSSQRIILNSLITVYEALNPLRKVVPIFDREKKLYRYLQNDQVDLIFRSYLLTDVEQKDIGKRKLNPKINTLWTDGLAVIAAKSFPLDSIHEEDLVAVLTHRSNAFHLIIDNSNTATYDLIFDHYAIHLQQINAYAAGSEDAVIQSVKQHDQYIGLIGSSYFTVKQESLPKDVKLLGLIHEGKKKAEYPFQDQLYNGVYPLARKIYGINVGALDASAAAFTSFILSERGQRIILKSGLLPAKIPSRTIELITE